VHALTSFFGVRISKVKKDRPCTVVGHTVGTLFIYEGDDVIGFTCGYGSIILTLTRKC